MNYCRYTKTSRINRLTACFLMVIVLSLVGCCIYGYMHTKSMSDYVTVCVLFLFTLVLGWKIAIPYFELETRRYSITKDGIIIGSFFRKPQFYCWGQIKQIGVFAFEANSSVTAYGSVICCFWGNKEDDFEKRIVKNYFYAAYRLSDFVLIDYSNDVIELLCSVYPWPILDYRPEQIRYYNLETYQKMKRE